MVASVVQVAASGGAPAAGMGAGAVADLDVAGKGRSGKPVVGALVEPGKHRVAPGVLGGDVGHDSGPVRGRAFGGMAFDGEPVELLGRRPAVRRPRRGTAPAHRFGNCEEAGRAASGHPGQPQVALVVGDGKAPFRTSRLPVYDGTGERREDRAEPGYLPGPLVEPEQRGQPDPDLDADSYRLVAAGFVAAGSSVEGWWSVAGLSMPGRSCTRRRTVRDRLGRAGVLRSGVLVRAAAVASGATRPGGASVSRAGPRGGVRGAARR